MAISVSVGAPLLVDADPKSNSIDVGTDPEALVVLVAAGGNNDLHLHSTITIGGQALSYVRQGAIIGRNAYLFELLSPAPMSGSQTFQVACPFGSFGTLYAIPYALKGGGAGILRTDDAGSGQVSGDYAVTLDSGVRLGVGLVAARGDTAGISPKAGTTEDHEGGGTYLGHETAPGTGSRSVGWGGGASRGVVGAMYVEGAAFAVPAAPGAEAGVPGFEVTQGDPVIFAQPFLVAGARAGTPSGFRLVAEGPASVYLGTPGRERPRWTDVPPVPGEGPDVPVLVHRRARRPEFAQLGALLEDLGFDPEGLPAGTDPGDLLVWDGDGWAVLPVGEDDEVLTADSGEDVGVAWKAGGGGGGGGAPVGAGLFVSSPNSALPGAGTETKVNFDTVEFDTASMADTTNDQLTIPTGKGGLWLACGVGFFDNIGTTTNQGLFLYRNGSSVTRVFWIRSGGGADRIVSFSVLLPLDAGDTVQLWANDTGGNSNIGSNTRLALLYQGPLS